MSRLVALVLLTLAVVHGKHEKYEGHELYRVAGPTNLVVDLEGRLDILSATPAARSETGQLEVLVRLSPEERPRWLSYFNQRNMSVRKIADNLADIIRDEEAMILKSKQQAVRNGRSISFDTYYNHTEINNWLDSLAVQYPNLVTVVNAGLSYEGRQIKLVRISNTRFEDQRKPIIVIDAAVHAREWVTPPVACYIINQLVIDAVDNRLTQGIDWVIIPVANPDGYEYSINEDRMWRKTRSRAHVGSNACPGVDGNRNFNHYWGTVNNTRDPCTILYEGPSPFSEPEIRIIRDAVLRDINRTEMYLSLHSYGNMFLYAWGNNGTIPENGADLQRTGDVMAAAIDQLALASANRYVVGNAANVLYFTTGTSRDWTRAAGVPLTYTLELPGYQYGFVVPPNYTRQIVTETWAGIAAGAHHILLNYPNSSVALYSSPITALLCAISIVRFFLHA